jgi:hypothetical protein
MLYTGNIKKTQNFTGREDWILDFAAIAPTPLREIYERVVCCVFPSCLGACRLRVGKQGERGKTKVSARHTRLGTR